MIPAPFQTPLEQETKVDFRSGVVVLGRLLGLTEVGFQKVFGLNEATLVALEGGVNYRNLSDKIFEVLSQNPNEALSKSESLAVRKLISLLSVGNAKMEFEAATEILNRLRGKPINTTHVVSQSVNTNITLEELISQNKASDERLSKLMEQRNKLAGGTAKSTPASNQLTLDAILVEDDVNT